MLKSSVSFFDQVVKLLPYKFDVPGLIFGVSPNFFQLFLS